MQKYADGMKFNKLTALEIVGTDVHGYKIWRCKCDCGNYTNATTRQLREGKKRDCGCMKGVRKDLTGMRFGKLTALEPVGKLGSTNSFIWWKCRCDCGNELNVEGRRLTGNVTKSCGCGRVTAFERYQGSRFGRLVVTENTGKKNNGGSPLFTCQCDCGNTIVVSSGQLVSGNTKSCGCIKRGRKPKLQQIAVAF